MKKIAIACQGGGSHCAFTAGVLAELLRRVTVDERDRLVVDGQYECIGLTGTSGGAISAYLAWTDLLRLRTQPRRPIGTGGTLAVERFWARTAARWVDVPPYDRLSNAALVAWSRLEGLVPMLSPSPNAFTGAVQALLKRDIEEAAELSEAERALHDGGITSTAVKSLEPGAEQLPLLLIGAANVNDAVFMPFIATPAKRPTFEQIIASTALPDLFPPVPIEAKLPPAAPDARQAPATRTSYYWDGLLSQNPPIGDLLSPRELDARPDEIWIVRINPAGRVESDAGTQPPPRTRARIMDRRNELAGNLSLEQEKRFVRKINALVDDGHLSAAVCKRVDLWGIALEGHADVPESADAPDGNWHPVDLQTPLPGDLDYASKLSRDPSFIAALQARGREAAQEFLQRRAVRATAASARPAAAAARSDGGEKVRASVAKDRQTVAR